jgi:cytochrome c oxidase subunit 4
MAHEHHKDDGAVHAHIASVPFYVGIFMALTFLTIVTVGVSYIHLGKANLIVAVIIASIKAALVLLFFMHLKYDTRFHGLIVIATVCFIGVFFAYTMNDTERRAEVDDASTTRIWVGSNDPAPGGLQAKPVPSGGHGAAHGGGGEHGKAPEGAGHGATPAPATSGGEHH